MTQASLFDRPEPRTHKRVRQVSTERYHAMVGSGVLAQRQREFLESLVVCTEQIGRPPTMAELASWAHAEKRLVRADPNIYRPRATELSGCIVEYLPRRTCSVTGAAAHPVRIRHVGSQAPR